MVVRTLWLHSCFLGIIVNVFRKWDNPGLLGQERLRRYEKYCNCLWRYRWAFYSESLWLKIEEKWSLSMAIISQNLSTLVWLVSIRNLISKQCLWSSSDWQISNWDMSIYYRFFIFFYPGLSILWKN